MRICRSQGLIKYLVHSTSIKAQDNVRQLSSCGQLLTKQPSKRDTTGKDDNDSLLSFRKFVITSTRSLLIPPFCEQTKPLIGPIDPMSSASQADQHEARLAQKYPPRERKFNTPYGHVASLEWGSEDAPCKVLCVHGWLDNAGSFERLVPFLLDHEDNAKRYHIVAIDHPGVGLSSHKPIGAEYTQFSTIIEMRRITQDLGWQTFSLLSHSLGCHYSFIYSCIFPDQVETFISIDLAHPIARNPEVMTRVLAHSIDEHFKSEHNFGNDPTTNIKIPVYNEADAVTRLMEAHSNSLTSKSAEVMLKRGATKASWGYTFNRDIRLKRVFTELGLDDELMLKYLDCSFKPNLLIIRALKSPYQPPVVLRERYYDMFMKKCPKFRDATLDGTHHLHMNDPQLVAPEICKFLDEITQSNNQSPGRSKL